MDAAQQVSERRVEKHLRLIPSTETVIDPKLLAMQPMDLTAAVERIELQNEFLINQYKEHASRLAELERRSTTTPTLAGMAISPSFSVGSAHTITGQHTAAYTLLSAAYTVPSPTGLRDIYQEYQQYLYGIASPYKQKAFPEADMQSDQHAPARSERGRDRQARDVPLHVVLEIGSLFAGTLAVGSIAAWLIGGSPLLNPFAAMLTLVASPFFFAMGRLARRNRAL